MTNKTIAFQGRPGAYSDLACQACYPGWETLACATFEDAFAAVREKKAELAMIPVENSSVGRVADIHHLLPDGKLHIIGEHYQPVEHHLLALPGTRLSDIKSVTSHAQALSQCRSFLKKHNMHPVIKNDTAGSAAELKVLNDKSVGAIASSLAGKIYGLESLAGNIADQAGNTTRFIIMAAAAKIPPKTQKCITTFVFRVRSVPAALYKALGGFATNGINITKLESYMVDNRFTAAQFHMDVEGHPEDLAMRHAFEELNFFANEIKVLGVYPAQDFRAKV
jgi:prephenate dehydratase